MARTALGARPTSGRPIVTYSVLAVLAVVFAGQLADSRVTNELAFYPALSRAEPWRFLTVGLVHSPGFVLHIGLNALVLWQVGRELELMMGRWRYLAVLALTTIAGSVAILWLTQPTNAGWVSPTVGISGAIFGLFGAGIANEWANRRPVGRQFLTILVFALLGVVVPGISWQGHVGGLIAGLLAGVVLAKAPRSNRTTWQVAGLAAIALLLIVLTLVRWAIVPASSLA